MSLLSKLLLAGGALLGAWTLAPAPRPTPPEKLAGEAIARAAIEPLRGWLAPWHWIAVGNAIAARDAERAYDQGRRLLFLLPQDGEVAAQLVLYFGGGAAVPLLEEIPPRVDEAFERILLGLELGREALDRGARGEVERILGLVLEELAADYHGNFGLRARYEALRGEDPSTTRRRWGLPTPEGSTNANPAPAGPEAEREQHG